jgi:hypothetical protein
MLNNKKEDPTMKEVLDSRDRTLDCLDGLVETICYNTEALSALAKDPKALAVVESAIENLDDSIPCANYDFYLKRIEIAVWQEARIVGMA